VASTERTHLLQPQTVACPREAAGSARTRPVRAVPGTQSIPFFTAPGVLNRPHSITASIHIPEEGAEGALLCQGTVRSPPGGDIRELLFGPNAGSN
jgi:hypothetical protein